MRDPRIDPAVGDELEDVFRRIVIRKVSGSGTTLRVDVWETTRDRVLGTSTAKATNDLSLAEYAVLIKRMRVKFASTATK